MQQELKLTDIGDFADLFEKANEYQATDIYILEGRLPRLGRLKSYSPVAEYPETSRGDIEELIQTTMSLNGDNGNDPKQFANKEYAFAIEGHGRYRISATQSEEGIGLSIRKLPYYIPALKDIDKRNFLKGVAAVFEGKETKGLILHTGATGSGKSTSIASEVDAIARNISGNILTFEAPIEYHYTPTRALIRQFEIGTHVDSYIEGMKLALRNDISVVVIGEVRTHDEIRSLVDIAMRGHLVFATLHTSNVLNTLRFLDSISDNKESWRQLLGYSLRAIVSQKLIYMKDQGFIFIPEVFIPNDVMRNKISRGEFKDIKEVFYSNNLRGNGSFTFEDTLSILCKERVISETDKLSIHNTENAMG